MVGVAAAPQPAAAPAPTLTALPEVTRPDVPDTTEQVAPKAEDSFLGRIASVADNIVPDDIGGALRGQSGWLANIPGYRPTLGSVASGALTGGGAVMDVLYWGSEQSDHLAAMAVSRLPGGLDSLSWNQAHNVSAGQAAAAETIGAESIFGGLINIALDTIIEHSADPEAARRVRAEWQGQDGFFAVTNRDIDLNNKAMREKVMHAGAGQLISGGGDAIWDVIGDPTIIGGKVSSIARYGSKAGGMGGLSNQALRTVDQVRGFGSRVDDGVQYVATGGQAGKWTAEAENVKDLITKPAEQLDANPFVKSSSNPLLLKRLALQVQPDDFATGAALVKAGAGDATGWQSLRHLNPTIYDQLALGMGVDPLGPLSRAATLTEDQIAYGSSLVAAANEAQAAGQLITRGGNRVSAGAARAANAYRKGATKNKFGTVHEGPTLTTTASPFPRQGWVSDVVEMAAGSRPIRAVRWVGQGTPSGIVHLKGGDGSSAASEVQAFLQKSSMDQRSKAGFYRDFTLATTPEQKRVVLAAIEDAETTAIAARNGVSAPVARAMYESYAKARHRQLLTLRRKNGFAVDEGELVTTPGLYTELDEAFPMLNQAIFRKVTKANARWLRTVEDVELVADTVNTWWKLSVLIRLGYTQRNITEGFLRSVAAIGTAAANPKSLTNLPANVYLYSGSRRLRRSIRQQDKALTIAHENLMDARTNLLAARKDAGVEDMFKARSDAAALGAPIRRLEGLVNRTARQDAELGRLTARRDALLAQAEDIRTSRVDPAVPSLTGLGREEALLLNHIDDLSSQILSTSQRLHARNARRVRTGRSENVMDDGTEMQGAFQGAEGDIAALISSADSTAYQTFDRGFEARRAAQEASEHYRPLDPRDMGPQDIQRYWDEYAIRLNQRYRNDSIIQSWLARDAEVTGRNSRLVMDDTKAWLMSPEGKGYRDSVSVHGRRLSDDAGRPREAAIEQYLTELWHRYNTELPQDTGLRQMVAEGAVTPAEVKAAFRTSTPPPIPVRELGDGGVAGTVSTIHDKAQKAAGTVMRALGSFPETSLLRHPFYNSIYKTRQQQLYRLAAEQGQDVASATVKTRINKAAHGDALKATRSTMYTIERLSNAANLLRWVAPFFPAFENSLRVWGRLVYTNPAVLGYGALLWNVPNNLGMVYDKDGKPAPRSNMFKDEDHVVVLPQQVTDFLNAALPEQFEPGVMTQFRQHSANVIFPGGEWWWPGVGPMAQTPVALVLRGKPETQDVLRSVLSEDMYRSIVPSGDANADLTELWLSTTSRRVKQMWGGDDEDGAFLTLTNTMIEDAYIDAQIAGRPLTSRDVKAVMDKRDKFWRWQIRSATSDAVMQQYRSPYAVERALWTKLADDQSLSYDQKITAFLDKTGGTDFLAVTRSGSESDYGVQPTLSAWQKISGNPDLVEQLDGIDPELVGMFANMGSFDDPYSYSVYGEFKHMRIGDDGKPVRGQRSPDSLIRNNEISDGWREWTAFKEQINEQAVTAGFKSAQSSEEFKSILDEGEARLKERFPAWGDEKDVYTDKLPLFIKGARILVDNASLVNEDSTISALREWIQTRDYIAKQKDAAKGDDEKRQWVALGVEAAAVLRDSDIGFADLFDHYLSDDDFRVL